MADTAMGKGGTLGVTMRGTTSGMASTRIAAGVGAGVFLLCGIVCSGTGIRDLCITIAGLLALAGILLPYVTRISLPGGAGVDFEHRKERDAAATAADRTVEDPTEAIESDDSGPPLRSPDDPTINGFLNFRVGDLALHAIFADATAPGSPLEGCEVRLYLLDEDAGHLSAVLHPGGHGSGWDIDQGVTGRAYARKQYLVEVGEALWQGVPGLSREQIQRYKELAAVAACPVFTSHGGIIGVLTASTTERTNALPTDRGRQELILAAMLTSRVLVELLQWFDE